MLFFIELILNTDSMKDFIRLNERSFKNGLLF